MNNYSTFRASAIRYWERRRLLYNLTLVLPSVIAYMVGTAINYAADNPYNVHHVYCIVLFILSALAANICYSFAYALEFIFGNDNPQSWWMRFGRTTFFVLGVLFAMFLAFLGGANISVMEFYYH